MDAVFHLAALIGIPFSYHAPDSYVDTNVKGTLNILQAAMAHTCERVVVTSTSEVYGTARYVPIDENHPLQGQSPYSASKIAADMLAESFHKSFGVPVTTVRPFNTYGPRQSSRAVIPTIITQLLNGHGTVKMGNLLSLRDFCYVADTVEGFVRIAECDAAVGEVVNIATGREISMGTLAEELIRQIHSTARVEQETQRLRPEKSEVDRLLGSTEKLRALTSWTPQHDLAQGLEKTVRWFSVPENLARYSASRYVV
jgi:nucleoside-diphosphate-sugar epimerase